MHDNSDSVSSIDSDQSRTVQSADVFEDGSAVICPDCGGDLDYLSREYVKCTDCEADYSHYWQFAGVGKRHELRDSDGDQVAVYDERQIDDDPELVTDGGESQQTTEQRTCIHGQMTKGIPNCSKPATHTGGWYYAGPVCEKHAKDDSEPLNEVQA